jgi:HAD superfamily hydrolase (TIGR01509 family)
VRDLLASRGIVLPEGTPADAAGESTVAALGNRKNALFNDTIREEGVDPYPASVAFIDAAIAAGYEVAVVSSSKNTPEVLAAAGLAVRFEVIVDVNLAAQIGLGGKPAPDTYLHAAELLGVPAAASVVVEDAESGVRAGAAGAFGLVIGVDRGLGHDRLLAEGADVVVDELDELLPLPAPAREL